MPVFCLQQLSCSFTLCDPGFCGSVAPVPFSLWVGHGGCTLFLQLGRWQCLPRLHRPCWFVHGFSHSHAPPCLHPSLFPFSSFFRFTSVKEGSLWVEFFVSWYVCFGFWVLSLVWLFGLGRCDARLPLVSRIWCSWARVEFLLIRECVFSRY